MSTCKKLEGKVAVVLGAAGKDNMGQAIARRFAEEGAKVIVAGRTLPELAQFAAAIDGAAKSCDITCKEDLLALFAFAREWGRHVDVAVNATGWGLLKPFTETTEEELERIAALQFKGPFMFFQAAVDTRRGAARSSRSVRRQRPSCSTITPPTWAPKPAQTT